MKVVAQARSSNGDLTFVGGAEAGLDVDSGNELKDILEIRLTSGPNLRGLDDCDRARYLCQLLAPFRKI